MNLPINELIFIGSAVLISVSILFCARVGVWALFGAVAVLSIMENLFITKSIALFGLEVTAADVYEIGMVFGLNLIHEFYGRRQALYGIGVYGIVTVWFALFGQIHLWFVPTASDVTHAAFAKVLEQNPRVALASIVTSAAALMLDWKLYARVRRWLANREFWIASLLSTSISQVFDTALFTVLALWGVYNNLWEIFIFSLLVKLFAIALTNPIGHIAKRLGLKAQVDPQI